MDLSLQDIVRSEQKLDDGDEEEEGGLSKSRCSPWGALKHYVSFGLIPGFGLFSESYLLFIFNQIAGPFKSYAPWTTCYSGEMDGYTKMASLVGIIVGMLFFGFFADKMGRRVGSIATNVLMLAGAIMLTAASPAPFPDGDNQACHQFFWWIFGSYFCFGIGVGGEYPLSASIASERSIELSATKQSRVKRGRDVLLTFSCQGVGQNIGNMVFFFLTLACSEEGNCGSVDVVAMNYRVSMGISLIFLTFLLPYRVMRGESAVYEKMKEKRAREGLEVPGYLAIFKHYSLRLVGTCGSWFLWDIVMYGNSLFSRQVTQQVNSGLSELSITGYTWLYTAVALPGYFFAAFTVDRAWMGRKRLQTGGFILVGLLFFIIGGIMPILQEPQNTGAFVFLYCLATFFYQFGPNATTFLIPAEVYATPVRARCHGLSAMSGKIGALVGEQGIAQMLDKVGLSPMFYVMGSVSIAGAALTIFMVPDSRTLDLVEEDQKFICAWLGDDKAKQFFQQSNAASDAVDHPAKSTEMVSLGNHTGKNLHAKAEC
jgi:MFS family permease